MGLWLVFGGGVSGRRLWWVLGIGLVFGGVIEGCGCW